MTNKLNKEQKKRFDDKYKFEGLFKGDALIGLNILKKNIKQHLADEIARAIEAVLKKTSHKPYCSEKDPCGCHFGETLHVDGKCFCDEVQKIVNSLQEEKVRLTN